MIGNENECADPHSFQTKEFALEHLLTMRNFSRKQIRQMIEVEYPEEKKKGFINMQTIIWSVYLAAIIWTKTQIYSMGNT